MSSPLRVVGRRTQPESERACQDAVTNLNQLLADTIILRDLYKKHHWQVAGPTSISSICCSTSTKIVSGVIRANELQVWFVAEHVVDMPLTRVP